MSARRPNLAPPTMQERADAAVAARALRRAIADPSTMGVRQTTHVDFSRPRRGSWITTWSGLSGFSRVDRAYHHECLPGWSYARSEIKTELIPDLEMLAERGVRPSEATGVAA